MTTILERLKKIIVEQLGAEDEEVVPTANFVDDFLGFGGTNNVFRRGI